MIFLHIFACSLYYSTIPLIFTLFAYAHFTICSLLSQYRFCAGGVLGGAAYGIKAKKGVVPMVIAGVAGTVSDLVYGYVKACKGEVVEYQRNNGNTGSGN